MPAAAVIPAPKAYIKVVAVKTSVVEFTLDDSIAGSSLSQIGCGLGDKAWFIAGLTSVGFVFWPGVLP